MRRVALIFSGGGSNMEALARSMQGDHPARPVLALCNRPEAGGIARARALGIATQVIPHRGLPRAEFEAQLLAALRQAEVDLIAFAGFMRILSPVFFQGYQGDMLNIHPSLLPLYPGLDTHARALAAGDAEAGCTVHEVIPELDAGPILGQARVPVQPGDTPEALAARVLVEEHRLYPAVLRRFAAGDRRPLQLGAG